MRNVCTEAGLFAIRSERDFINQEDMMKVSPSFVIPYVLSSLLLLGCTKSRRVEASGIEVGLQARLKTNETDTNYYTIHPNLKHVFSDLIIFSFCHIFFPSLQLLHVTVFTVVK